MKPKPFAMLNDFTAPPSRAVACSNVPDKIRVKFSATDAAGRRFHWDGGYVRVEEEHDVYSVYYKNEGTNFPRKPDWMKLHTQKNKWFLTPTLEFSLCPILKADSCGMDVTQVETESWSSCRKEGKWKGAARIVKIEAVTWTNDEQTESI